MNEKKVKPIGEKMYYSISEVSQMLGINASTLRYWEKELPSVNPRKSMGGTRRYTAIDVEELRMIHRLVKIEGHTIEGVRNLLRRKRRGEMSKQDLIGRLQYVRNELSAMIAEIERISPVDK